MPLNTYNHLNVILLNWLQLSILRHELPQVTLIDSELEVHLQSFKDISSKLSSKLEALKQLSERLDEEKKKEVIEFVEKIQESWKKTAKEVTFLV